MRHRVQGRKLGRPSDQRMALLKNLVVSLFRHDRIETTVQKAKEVRRVADRLITTAKLAPKPDEPEENREAAAKHVAAWRQVLKVITDKRVVAHLFTEIAQRYVDRQGGYTRVVRAGRRRGDGAELAILELMD